MLIVLAFVRCDERRRWNEELTGGGGTEERACQRAPLLIGATLLPRKGARSRRNGNDAHGWDDSRGNMAVKLLDEIGSDLLYPSEQPSYCNRLENVPGSSFYHPSFSPSNSAMTEPVWR